MIGQGESTTQANARNKTAGSVVDNLDSIGVDADKTEEITRLIKQVQKLLSKSGNCEPFDAAAWVKRLLRRPDIALGNAAPELYLNNP